MTPPKQRRQRERAMAKPTESKSGETISDRPVPQRDDAAIVDALDQVRSSAILRDA